MNRRPKFDCKTTRRNVEAMADSVAAILENTVANRYIDFRIGTFRVSPYHLALVGNAIRSGEVLVSLGDPGEAGFYDGDTNMIILPSLDTVQLPENWGGVIHEGVHAVNDMMSRTIGSLDDECSGYIAQGIYARTNIPRIRFGEFKPDGTPVGDLCAYMIELADQVIAGKAMDAGTINKLRQTILRIPYYSGIEFEITRYNGI